MDLFAIFRRNGVNPEEVEEADVRSRGELATRSDAVRKIRTYVLEEPGGRIGTICLYQATGPEAILEHARAARLPADEVVKVVAIDVQRPDPELATA